MLYLKVGLESQWDVTLLGDNINLINSLNLKCNAYFTLLECINKALSFRKYERVCHFEARLYYRYHELRK